MPFVRVELSESTNNTFYQNRAAIPEKPEQIPLYLIPDIFENPLTFQHLAQELHACQRQRPIYIYVSDITPPDQHDAYTLDNEAELIANELQSVTPYNHALIS